jgi:hypothetical protein
VEQLKQREAEEQRAKQLAERQAKRAAERASMPPDQWKKRREQEMAEMIQRERQKQQQNPSEPRHRKLKEDLISGKIAYDANMERIWLTPEERIQAHRNRMNKGKQS